MEKKKGIIITTIVVLLLLVVGVTYAFFTYESGTKSDIVTGQIYMNYEETSTISLTGVFPETKEQALARNDENGVFEFTITGRNTSKYPVYYEIDLLEGGVMTGKTETSTKILPEHVRIYLERDGEPLVDGVTYKDWNNRRIYVETVPAGTTSNIEHKYTLRMWIDENVTISDTDPNADYTTSEWNDAYTSLKVRVVGDFEYKEVATDASCFAYNIIEPQYTTYDYLTEFTLDTSEEKVNTCVSYLTTLWGAEEEGNTVDVGETYEEFCNGTGTNWGMTMKELIAIGYMADEQMQSLGVVESYEFETRYYELNTSEESVNSCKEIMINFTAGYDNSDAKDSYQSFCEGTGTLNGLYIFGVFDDEMDGDGGIERLRRVLIERNVFTQVEELPQGEIEITNYDEITCGTDVIIPSTIEGLPVTRIADERFGIPATQISAKGNDLKNNTLENKNTNYDVKPVLDIYYGVFTSKGITSVKFPSTLKYIGNNAFSINDLTEVMITDSVSVIGDNVFSDNNIFNVEIGTGIGSIGTGAFSSNPLVTVNIKSNPSLGSNSFYAEYPSDFVSPIDAEVVNHFKIFQYNGTCAELNQYEGVFYWVTTPQTIITTDNDACEFTNFPR